MTDDKDQGKVTDSVPAPPKNSGDTPPQNVQVTHTRPSGDSTRNS